MGVKYEVKISVQNLAECRLEDQNHFNASNADLLTIISFLE